MTMSCVPKACVVTVDAFFSLMNSELDFAIKYDDVNSAEIMIPKTKRSKLIEISRRLLWSDGKKSNIFRIVDKELEIRNQLQVYNNKFNQQIQQ